MYVQTEDGEWRWKTDDVEDSGGMSVCRGHWVKHFFSLLHIHFQNRVLFISMIQTLILQVQRRIRLYSRRSERCKDWWYTTGIRVKKNLNVFMEKYVLRDAGDVRRWVRGRDKKKSYVAHKVGNGRIEKKGCKVNGWNTYLESREMKEQCSGVTVNGDQILLQPRWSYYLTGKESCTMNVLSGIWSPADLFPGYTLNQFISVSKHKALKLLTVVKRPSEEN